MNNLPSKWCIKITNENKPFLMNLRDGELHFKKYYDYTMNAYYSSIRSDIGYEFYEIPYGYTEITFEQFKQFILKEKPMETKEIIGYEILKTVWGFEGNRFTAGSFINIINKESLPYFKELGILNDTSIFKPMYKEEKYPLNYSELKSNEFYCCEYERQGVYIFQHNNKFWMNSNKEVNSHSDGEFKPSNGFHKFRKATTEEIEEILLLEAKERYPIGCKIKLMSKNTGGDFDNKVKFTKYQIYDNGKQIYIDGNLLLYDNGKWAEILSSYPQIAINGYKGEFFNDYVKFGCAEISKQVFIDLYQLNQSIRNGDMAIGRDSNREIVSATIGKGTFSKEQIKEIAEYYLQKK